MNAAQAPNLSLGSQAASPCSKADIGRRLLRLSWHESDIAGTAANYLGIEGPIELLAAIEAIVAR
jgi:hypothetical protein